MSKLSMQTLMGEPGEMGMLQALLEAAPIYHRRVMGQPAGPDEAQGNCAIVPPNKSYDDKFSFGFFLEDELVGYADLIRAYTTK